ncbi:hypothetical protein [Lapidilactobacillus bayanensis]|uniref:hypothetical protein n=1 Tax=Lapidilactobacillus bayanensis TaxID=2485998 RepID=UPI000F79C194|nr:hypothetical protein [Lapidilactobacillus bayanensis]
MKKKIFLDLVLVLLTFLMFLCFRQNEQRNNESRLNRNGLSVDSLIVTGAKKQSLETVVQQISKSSLKHYQIQFVDEHDPNFSYIYAEGDGSSQLPLISGRFFNQNDYESEVPFVVLGTNLTKSTYQPQAQQYYDLSGNYYAVIGVTGVTDNSAINNHTFISLSPKQQLSNQITTSQFRIIYDPVVQKSSDTKKLLQILQATGTKRLVDSSSITRERQGWFARSGMIITQVILILALMIIMTWILAYLVIFASKQFNLGSFLQNQLTLKMLGQLATHLVLATGIGFLIGWQTQEITTPVIILGIIMIFDLIALVGTYLYLTYSQHYTHLKQVLDSNEKQG